MRTLTPRPSLRVPRPRPRPPRSALAAPPALHGDALLCTKFPAHAAAVTAVAVVQENGALCGGGNWGERGTEKEAPSRAAPSRAAWSRFLVSPSPPPAHPDTRIHVATGSVDKQVAVWAISTDCPGVGETPCAVDDESSPSPPSPSAPTRVEAHAHPRGPVFSLAVDLAGAAAATTLGDGAPPAGGLAHVFWGGGGESVVRALAPPAGPLPYTLDAGATGWVRCLLASRRTLYSAVCGTVTAWDLSRAVPRPIGSASLFKSDVTALAASADGAWLYAGAADGSITAWALDTNGAPLTATGVTVPSAHAGRDVSAAVHPFSGVLLSASADGALAAWMGARLVAATPAAAVRVVRQPRRGVSNRCGVSSPHTAAPPCAPSPWAPTAASTRGAMMAPSAGGGVATWRRWRGGR